MRPVAFLAVIVALCPTIAAAQTCEPATDSFEAEIFGVRSLSLAMGRAAAIAADRPWTIRSGAEAVLLPNINENQTPACRSDKQGENVNILPVAGRARIAVALPGRFSLDVSWLPPVTLRGVQGNVIGVALGHAHPLSPVLTLGVRAHATVGHVTGPFTCGEDEVQDSANSVCYQGTVSSDRLEPNVLGGDITLGWVPSASRYAWYAGGGYSHLTPRFQVHFVDRNGILDKLQVRLDLNRVALFGGVSRAIGARWRASAEVYATTQDGATARVAFDGIIRQGK